MSFIWKEYLLLASSLRNTLDQKPNTELSESILRCAVSRAYYAAFCTARNMLIENGTPINSIETHKQVREEFRSTKYGSKGQLIRNGLLAMHIKRKDADYEDLYPNQLKTDAKSVIVTSSKVIQYVAELKEEEEKRLNGTTSQ